MIEWNTIWSSVLNSFTGWLFTSRLNYEINSSSYTGKCAMFIFHFDPHLIRYVLCMWCEGRKNPTICRVQLKWSLHDATNTGNVTMQSIWAMRWCLLLIRSIKHQTTCQFRAIDAILYFCEFISLEWPRPNSNLSNLFTRFSWRLKKTSSRVIMMCDERTSVKLLGWEEEGRKKQTANR